MKPCAWVLDLGSTRLKLAAFDPRGALHMLADRAFPQVKAKGLIYEADPQSFRDRVQAMLMKIPAEHADIPLGISSQRSSFLLWERESGKPLTRIICWQDRRAQAWCQEKALLEPTIWARTGLPLSPHYAGPKLAYLLANDRWLAAMARSGDACFGTLETYLSWCWSGGAIFQTDPGMAARTLLLELDKGDWSEEILEHFGIPKVMLPRVGSFRSGSVTAPFGGSLKTVIPDQSAAALPLFEKYPHSVILNAGTGTFLLRKGEGRAPEGFLSTRLASSQLEGDTRIWEAPINSGVDLWRQWKAHFVEDTPLELNHFASPEAYGWAAPYWRSDLGQTCTGEALAPHLQASLFMEGFAFRIRQAIEGLFPNDPPERVLIGGGLTRDPLWLSTLAGHVDVPLYRLDQAQLSLLGVGWQVDRRRLDLALPMEQVTKKPLATPNLRYRAWCDWIQEMVDL